MTVPFRLLKWSTLLKKSKLNEIITKQMLLPSVLSETGGYYLAELLHLLKKLLLFLIVY